MRLSALCSILLRDHRPNLAPVDGHGRLRFCQVHGPASYIVAAADLQPRCIGNTIIKFADDSLLT